MNVSIIVDNTLSKISGINDSDFMTRIKKEFSYQITVGYYKGKWKFETVYLISSDLMFPTGLLPKMIGFFGDNQIAPVIIDRRTRPEGFLTLPRKKIIGLRPYQKVAIERAIENGRGIIESATGSGKTILIQELIYHYKLPTLVIVPSLNIMEQTSSYLQKIYGKSKVGMISANKPFSGGLNSKIPIFVASVQSLPNLKESFFNNIGLLIIDEFHHAAAETYQKLNMNNFKNIYHRFGLTGTNFRNDGADLALQGVLSDVVFQYSVLDGIADGYLCPVRFLIYKNRHPALSQPHKTYREEYSANIVNNVEFNQTIANIANRIKIKEIPQIIMVKEIAHGDLLQSLIPGSVFVTGEDKSRTITQQKLKDFKDGKYSVLIGTSVVGEGVDLPRAQVGIMAGGGKAESDVIQKIGRFLRLHDKKSLATIIDFTHDGSLRLMKHSLMRKAIYNTYGPDRIAMKEIPNDH